MAHALLGRAAWHAPNPAADYDAYVTEAGVRIAVNDQSFVSLHLHSVGYGAAMRAVASGSVSGTLQQRLLAADGTAFDCLGHGVALDGNTALVGAPADDTPNSEQGAAYVFVRSGATWTQQAKLTVMEGKANDLFGWAVTLDGDTALIGAPGHKVTQTDEGSVYVFVRNGTVWTQQQRLNANGTLEGAQFGAAIALDCDTVLVGAPSKAGKAQRISSRAAARR